MLEAPTDELTLSTTMPLVPTTSSTIPAGVPAVTGVRGVVISKDIMQPSFPAFTGGKAHFVSTETKRRSVAPFRNSVSGEHPTLFAPESNTSSVPALFIKPEPLKPTSHNAGTVLELSVPHT